MTRAAVLGAFAVWITCAAIRWYTPTPLAHDEARYALATKDFVEGRPARWVYVPTGMIAVGAPGMLAGGSDRALRVLPLLLGLGFLVAAWRAGCAIGGPETGAWTAAVVAGIGQLAQLQTDLLSDLPSAGCLLGAIAVLVHELRRDGGPSWRILWAAPLCAAAMYLRYGSCVVIVMIAVATLVMRRPDARSVRRMLATVALFGVLMVPHAAQALATTGSPFGIVLESASVPPRGGAYAAYFGHPIEYLGIVPTLLGLAALAGAWRDRWRLYAFALGLADILVLAHLGPAETRYVTVGIVLLVIAGVATLRDVIVRVPIAAAVAVGVTWAIALVHVGHHGELRVASMRATLVAVRAIAADAHGRPCEVLGRHALQIEWYSHCRQIEELPGTTGLVYAVRDNTGGPWQPAELPGTRIVDQPGLVEVTRLAAP